MPKAKPITSLQEAEEQIDEKNKFAGRRIGFLSEPKMIDKKEIIAPIIPPTCQHLIFIIFNRNSFI